MLNWNVPDPSAATDSQPCPFCELAAATSWPTPNISAVAVPLGLANSSILSGIPPPTRTVTLMLWGASIAFGSFTVTKPVYVPLAREAVWTAMFTGMQLFPKSQAWVAPSVGASHQTDAESCRG